MTSNKTMEHEPRGDLSIFNMSNGQFGVCRQTNMTDPVGRRDNEYEVLGMGDTISDALEDAAGSIPDDAEGVRYSDEW